MPVGDSQIDPSMPVITGRRHAWGRAYRDGMLVCDRVHVTIGSDSRLGLARHERRYVVARFVGRLHPLLRAELVALVRRRGAAALRVAEAMAPIRLVFDDSDLDEISGCIRPPQVRRGKLREIDFELRKGPR